MSNTTTSQRDTGLGFGTLLFLVFLVLKLTGVIAWSWWWVTAPLWVPVLLVIVVGLIAATVVTAKSRR